ncbi:hypothetical protein F4167_04075 [Candidatus Poribacteria bacterium]|nr:hypothetical protein [Candidatus Poribacteria bacterium]
MDMVRDVQGFFADEMDRHGFGRKTFQYNPTIEIRKGRHTLAAYMADQNLVWFELGRFTFLPENTADIVFMEGADRVGNVGNNGRGILLWVTWAEDGGPGDDFGYYLVWIPSKVTEWLLPILAHELGHAFGIRAHNHNVLLDGKRTVMYRSVTRVSEIEQYVFSLQEAKILDTSPFLSTTYAPHVPTHESGDIDADVNNDGRVDLSDVLVIRNAIQGSSAYDTDVNNDGKTDELDLLIVKAKAHAAIAAAAPMLRRRGMKFSTWGRIKRGY